MLQMNRKAVNAFGSLWGVEKSTISHSNQKYMTRWILYAFGGTLRLHQFFKGDDDRASHTHPWWFITFPLGSYREALFSKGICGERRTVKRFRFHYRAANFEHIVIAGVDEVPHEDWKFEYHERPFWTIVLTGRRNNDWGFYDKPNHFTPWRAYDVP